MEHDIEQELQSLSPAIERDPCSCAGRWISRRPPVSAEYAGARFREVRVDYGSGMGDYIVESAIREPDVMFVGVERELFCIAKSARKVIEAGLHNAIFVPAGSTPLDSIFAPGEARVIHINFPTPYARKHDATMRMTHLDQLMRYRHILASDGVIRFKTDSQPLRDFTLAQLVLAGYRLNWSVDDIREVLPDDPRTGYETRLVDLGATVYALEATPGPEPAIIAQTAHLSLFDYLPDNLESMTYIPTDMERSVRNMIEARARIAHNRKHDDPIAPLDAME